MKMEKKNQIIIDLSTQAAITALEHHREKDNGKPIYKADLFASISRRVGWMMMDSDDMIYEEEAIPPPDNKFLRRHWKNIKPHAANKYKKYIIPNTNGIRLGTLEEYCCITQNQDMPIVKGIAKSAAKRARIARKHGGDSPEIDANIKQLPPSTE